MMKKFSGFTLIELLVVIAIISILAAILFPVFMTAREKARQSSCASNEKQIALGVLQYTQDYDEWWPQQSGNGPFGWAGKVYPYVKSTQVFKCPDDNTPDHNAATDAYAVSYAFNYNLSDDGNGGDEGAPTTTKMNSPVVTVMLCEIRAPQSNNVALYNPNEANAQNVNGGNGGTDCGALYSSGTSGNWYATGEMGQPARTACIDPTAPLGRHTNMSNFAFSDGHVKALAGSSVSPGHTPVGPGNSQPSPNCGQDVTNCEYGSYNAAGTGYMGTPPQNFVGTFSPL